jgi:hypothetical protein
MQAVRQNLALDHLGSDISYQAFIERLDYATYDTDSVQSRFFVL